MHIFHIILAFSIWLVGLIVHALLICYRLIFSATSGRQCRFEPTCSHYAQAAFKHHHFFKAILLTIRRLWRCSPFSAYRGNWHFDPVPSADPNSVGDSDDIKKQSSQQKE